ncbi:MAG: 50S ribosomal protein L30 [Candidatus Odinarchaeia archaeon]
MERTKRLTVIRIRGTVDINKDLEYTLKLLRLHKPNHAVLIDDRKTYLKMLHKIASYIAWGEISQDTLEELLKKRGRIIGNKPLTDEYIKENSKFKSISDFAKKLFELKAEIKDVPGLKPVFRLHPPRKGFDGSKKRAFQVGGVLGYYGSEINKLVRKMM